MAKQDTILTFTRELVKDYFTWASSQGLKQSTLHRKMAAINEFAKWGVKQGLWSGNPMDAVDRVRRPKHTPRPFSADELKRLLELKLNPRDRALRAVLVMTGLRITPVCMLKVGDLSFDPPQIRAWVKGSKTQVIEMHPALKALLYDYVLVETDLKGQTFLFRNTKGRPLNRKSAEKVVAAWGAEAKVPTCLPHRFRHSFGTELLIKTKDLRLVQEALGHEDISSTAIYTKVTQERLREGIAQLDWGV
jgi:site-specific recombinase XerD